MYVLNSKESNISLVVPEKDAEWQALMQTCTNLKNHQDFVLPQRNIHVCSTASVFLHKRPQKGYLPQLNIYSKIKS